MTLFVISVALLVYCSCWTPQMRQIELTAYFRYSYNHWILQAAAAISFIFIYFQYIVGVVSHLPIFSTFVSCFSIAYLGIGKKACVCNYKWITLDSVNRTSRFPDYTGSNILLQRIISSGNVLFSKVLRVLRTLILLEGKSYNLD